MANSPNGLQIDRFGDIFSGYFSQACARHLGHSIRAGTPIAEHRRNAHRYLRDATQEMAGIWVLEDLLPWLADLRLDVEKVGFLRSRVALAAGLANHERGEPMLQGVQGARPHAP